ncbi:MAG: hypothetical protein AAF958_13255 [Planctomycetota bacterium]
MSLSLCWVSVIREGGQRNVCLPWIMLRRELIWGPEAFTKWFDQFDETEVEADSIDSVAVVDFDGQRLLWAEDTDAEPMATHRVYNRLLDQAWPDFSIQRRALESLIKMARVLHDSATLDAESSRSATDRALARFDSGAKERIRDIVDERYESVVLSWAALHESNAEEEQGDDSEDRVYDSEDDEPLAEGPDFPRAFITVCSELGKSEHRTLYDIPCDLIEGEMSVTQTLRSLPASQIPPESECGEGVVLLTGTKRVLVWGDLELKQTLPEWQKSWRGWTVAWLDGGYPQHCEEASIVGKSIGDAEALGGILPQLLSTDRIDPAAAFAYVGSSLKRAAGKTIGCLFLVFAIPMLLLGALLGRFQAFAIAMTVMAWIVYFAFKVVERKVRRHFDESFGQALENPSTSEGDYVPAGPRGQQARQQELDRLLAKANLPSIKQCGKYFDEDGFIPAGLPVR